MMLSEKTESQDGDDDNDNAQKKSLSSTIFLFEWIRKNGKK